MLFAPQEFSVRFAGDDFVGAPFRNVEEALAVAEAHALIDAQLRKAMDFRGVVPWRDD